MKPRFTFDIETGPQEASYLLEKFNPQFEANKTLKDPEKVKADIEDKKKKWLDDSALHAERGKVLVIGYKIEGKNTEVIDGDEKEIIGTLIALLSSSDYSLFCGFNILGFDLQFIRQRAIMLGVKVPFYDRTDKWKPWTMPVFDAMRDWNCGDYRAYTSLDTVARALEVGGKVKEKSKHFFEIYKESREDGISHCGNDVSITDSVVDLLLAY